LKKDPLRQKPGCLLPAFCASLKAIIGILGQIHPQKTLNHMFNLAVKCQNDSITVKPHHAAKLPPKVAQAAAWMVCRGWIGISQKGM
jgi:hypothetical protein